MMPIFIAKDYDGFIESVVLARSYELANAYWQGLGIYPHSTDTRIEQDLKEHPTGVLPIVKTKKKVIRPSDISSRMGYTELLVIDK